MKTIKSLCTVLTIAVAVTAVSATAATAHTWQNHGMEITTKRAVKAEGALRFNGKMGGIYECSVVVKGTVGPGALGEITSLTSKTSEKVIPCSTIRSEYCVADETLEVEPLFLPWKTELVTIGTELRNQIEGEAFAWKMYCKLDNGKRTYSTECRGEGPSNTAVKNVTGGVDDIFDNKTPLLSCIGYGVDGASVTGTLLLKPVPEEGFLLTAI